MVTDLAVYTKKILPTVTLNGRNVSHIGSSGKAIRILVDKKLPFQVRTRLYRLLVSALPYQEPGVSFSPPDVLYFLASSPVT